MKAITAVVIVFAAVTLSFIFIVSFNPKCVGPLCIGWCILYLHFYVIFQSLVEIELKQRIKIKMGIEGVE
jgi:hypothetical protein